MASGRLQNKEVLNMSFSDLMFMVNVANKKKKAKEKEQKKLEAKKKSKK